MLATGGGDGIRIFSTRTWTQATTIPGPGIVAFSFDPAGSRLATGNLHGEAAIWDLASGKQLRRLRESGGSVDAIAFSPDGKRIATGSATGAQQIWDAATGALQFELNILRSRILAVDWDPASRFTLAATKSGSIAVADAVTGMPVTVLEGPRNLIWAAHFDPSGRRVIAASWDGNARVWDATPPYHRWSSPTSDDDCGLMASLTPDQRYVAIGCRDHVTRVWDTARDRLLGELPSVTPVEGDFSSAFPAVSQEGDLERFRLVASLEGHVGRVYAARFVGDHGIMTAGEDGAVRLWDDQTGRPRETYHAGPRILVDATVTDDGSVVVAGGSEGILWFWDTATAHLLWRLQAHKSVVTGVRIDGDEIVTRAVSGEVSRWALPQPEGVIEACRRREACDLADEEVSARKPRP